MKGALLALCLSVFLCTAHSHSYLISPEADWTNDGQPECRIGKPDDPGFESLTPLNCPGPCGEPGKRADRGGGEFFSLTKGMTTFQRGQKFFAKWTRNNHFGGFVRFTLVPKSKRMEKHVHEMFAFHYSCWQAGEVGCSGSHECGTDEAGLRYQTEVQIPAVFPDGEYILGWTWFGGVRYRDGAERSEYGDYYSCANVKIEGGAQVEDEHKPQYIPGMNDRSVKKCLSSVDRLGVCTHEPCKRDGARFVAGPKTPHCFNPHSLEWESSYRIRSSDVTTAQKGGINYVNPCNGEQVEIDIGGAGDSGSNGQEQDINAEKEGGGQEGTGGGNPTQQAEGGGQHDTGGKPTLQAIKLVDSNSGEIKNYGFNGPINVAEYSNNMSVRVDVDHPENVSAMKFFINDQHVHTEGGAPFYIAGNDGNQVWPWQAPMNAQVSLRIDVEKNGQVTDSWTLHPEFRTNY